MRLREVAALVAVGLVCALPAAAQKEFELTPDSFVKPGVPQGDIQHFVLKGSKVFPGTERDVWVYIPKQYDGTKPAALMVFQDGGGFANREGGYRLPAVFDNLIARGEMPVTIGIMVNPGAVPPTDPKTQLPRYNRSVEYDGIDGRYAAFVIDELVPEVVRRTKVRLSDDPAMHGLCGGSSGGIASFTAAWFRPDYFGKVLGFISSFTDLRGGHTFPTLIRKTERKPLRIFLQDGVNDQDIYSGSWPIGNADVVAALRFSGYDHRYVTGPGGHDGRQGTAVLPEALRWLWRAEPLPVSSGSADTAPTPMRSGRSALTGDYLIAGEGWKPVTTPGPVDAVTTDAAGTVFVGGGGSLWRVGGAAPLRTGLGRIAQLVAGPGGTLYAALPDQKRIAVWDAAGKESTVARGFRPASIAVRHTGTVYALEEGTGKVLRIAGGKRSVADSGIPGSRSVCLVPDQGLLLVTPDPASGKYALSLRVAADETLTDRQHYHDIAADYGLPGTGAAGVAVDVHGWYYVATPIGIQMLDQAGRVNGIVLGPVPGGAGPIAFGGDNQQTLYAAVGGKLYSRRTRARGALPCQPPVKPPGPQL